MFADEHFLNSHEFIIAMLSDQLQIAVDRIEIPEPVSPRSGDDILYAWTCHSYDSVIWYASLQPIEQVTQILSQGGMFILDDDDESPVPILTALPLARSPSDQSGINGGA